MVTSGIRIGSPAVTSRGFGEAARARGRHDHRRSAARYRSAPAYPELRARVETSPCGSPCRNAVREVAGLSSVSMSTARLTIESIGPEHIDSLLAYHQRNEKHLARWEPSRSSDFFTRSYWSTYAAAVQDDAFPGARTASSRCCAARARSSPASTSPTSSTASFKPACSAIRSTSRTRPGLRQRSGRRDRDLVLSQFGLHRVEANYQPNNERSGRLLARWLRGRRLRARLSLHRWRLARPHPDREDSRRRAAGGESRDLM